MRADGYRTPGLEGTGATDVCVKMDDDVSGLLASFLAFCDLMIRTSHDHQVIPLIELDIEIRRIEGAIRVLELLER